MRIKGLAAIIGICALISFAGTQVMAAEDYTLRIKDHHFIPETLEIPAGEKVRIVIVNEDPTPEEFESYELNREKIIKGHGKGVVFVGPLNAGTYPFFGEFNMDTAKGQIVAK
ncbi:MAG: cupredoxin domain-containing protein [Alphaproteobacteria bacterium CG_4_9_14_3_um_filter_47_13]|nr:MAG: cupredoxin domain-containing protein [Alphaproteobacteria bacterium CG_4_9_14_3_um_filter_47_13]